MELGEVLLKLGIDEAAFARALESAKSTAQRKSSEIESSFKQLGSKLTSVGTTMSLAVTVPLVAAGVAALHAFEEADKALSTVNALIKSTGGSAGLTSAELQKMAAELQKISRFDDDEILSGVTAQLLTFTSIGKSEFPRAQKAILDIATVLGSDLQPVAIQVGKALNDPVKGLVALARSGIQFTESQKEVINKLWETGRTAEAQNLILKELEHQYGGTAEAAAKAGAGPLIQFKNNLGDLMEEFGKIISQALLPFVGHLQNLVTWFQNLSDGTKTAIVIFAAIAAAIGPVLVGLGMVVSSISLLSAGFAVFAGAGAVVAPVITAIALAGAVVASVIAAIALAFMGWKIAEWLGWTDSIISAFTYLKNIVIAVVSDLVDAFKLLWFAVTQQIGPAIGNFLTGAFDKLSGVLKAVRLDEVFHSYADIAEELWNVLKPLGGAISDLVAKAAQMVGLEKTARALQDNREQAAMLNPVVDKTRVLMGNMAEEVMKGVTPLKVHSKATNELTEAQKKAAEETKQLLQTFRDALSPADALSKEIKKLRDQHVSATDILKVYGDRIKEVAAVQMEHGRQLDANTTELLNLQMAADLATLSWESMAEGLQKTVNPAYAQTALKIQELEADTKKLEEELKLFEMTTTNTKEWDDALIQVMKDMKIVGQETTNVQKEAANFGKEVSTVFTNMTQNISQAIVEWKSFGEGLKSIVKEFSKGMLSVFLKELFAPLTSKMEEWGKKLADMLSKLLNKVFDYLGNLFSQISGKMGVSLGTIGAGLGITFGTTGTAGNIIGSAVTGAGIGTMISPGIGTAIGAAIGSLVGAIGSLFGSSKREKEAKQIQPIQQAFEDMATRVIAELNQLRDAGQLTVGAVVSARTELQTGYDDFLKFTQQFKLAGPYARATVQWVEVFLEQMNFFGEQLVAVVDVLGTWQQTALQIEISTHNLAVYNEELAGLNEVLGLSTESAGAAASAADRLVNAQVELMDAQNRIAELAPQVYADSLERIIEQEQAKAELARATAEALSNELSLLASQIEISTNNLAGYGSELAALNSALGIVTTSTNDMASAADRLASAQQAVTSAQDQIASLQQQVRIDDLERIIEQQVGTEAAKEAEAALAQLRADQKEAEREARAEQLKYLQQQLPALLDAEKKAREEAVARKEELLKLITVETNSLVQLRTRQDSLENERQILLSLAAGSNELRAAELALAELRAAQTEALRQSRGEELYYLQQQLPSLIQAEQDARTAAEARRIELIQLIGAETETIVRLNDRLVALEAEGQALAELAGASQQFAAMLEAAAQQVAAAMQSLVSVTPPTQPIPASGVPGFEHGGLVSANTLAFLHAGEQVLPVKAVRELAELQVPSFQRGGFVSENMLAFLHAGERVTPVQESQVQDVTVTFNPTIKVAAGNAERVDIERALERSFEVFLPRLRRALLDNREGIGKAVRRAARVVK